MVESLEQVDLHLDCRLVMRLDVIQRNLLYRDELPSFDIDALVDFAASASADAVSHLLPRLSLASDLRICRSCVAASRHQKESAACSFWLLIIIFLRKN